ncbi:antA/AntB antirepressor family protein [Geobacter sulfurreducens]|uniref:antA/AntB antirepressor family protein n=1 Tax=Geobacter sulfurreducens TaxID=35554 RepID=UPI0033057C30
MNIYQYSTASTETVNARRLHEFLEVGKDFSTWIKDRIEQYGFVQNQDFVIDSPVSGNQISRGGDRRSKDYHITLDILPCQPLCQDKLTTPVQALSPPDADYYILPIPARMTLRWNVGETQDQLCADVGAGGRAALFYIQGRKSALGKFRCHVLISKCAILTHLMWRYNA